MAGLPGHRQSLRGHAELEPGCPRHERIQLPPGQALGQRRYRSGSGRAVPRRQSTNLHAVGAAAARQLCGDERRSCRSVSQQPSSGPQGVQGYKCAQAPQQPDTGADQGEREHPLAPAWRSRAPCSVTRCTASMSATDRTTSMSSFASRGRRARISSSAPVWTGWRAMCAAQSLA